MTSTASKASAFKEASLALQGKSTTKIRDEMATLLASASEKDVMEAINSTLLDSEAFLPLLTHSFIGLRHLASTSSKSSALLQRVFMIITYPVTFRDL